MRKKKSIIKSIINCLYLFSGISKGIMNIWPGLLNYENRKCFFRIIKDGSDGQVSLGTILSIEPNSLLKIKNTKSKYTKILLIGDQCFRR